MKIAEIQTHAEPNAEWITVHKREGYVSIYVEYVDPDGDRIAWQDSGLSVRDEHLDKLIAALQGAGRVAAKSSNERPREAGLEPQRACPRSGPKSEAGVFSPLTAPYVGLSCKRSGRYKMVSDKYERVSKLYCDGHALD